MTIPLLVGWQGLQGHNHLAPTCVKRCPSQRISICARECAVRDRPPINYKL